MWRCSAARPAAGRSSEAAAVAGDRGLHRRGTGGRGPRRPSRTSAARDPRVRFGPGTCRRGRLVLGDRRAGSRDSLDYGRSGPATCSVASSAEQGAGPPATSPDADPQLGGVAVLGGRRDPRHPAGGPGDRQRGDRLGRPGGRQVPGPFQLGDRGQRDEAPGPGSARPARRGGRAGVVAGVGTQAGAGEQPQRRRARTGVLRRRCSTRTGRSAPWRGPGRRGSRAGPAGPPPRAAAACTRWRAPWPPGDAGRPRPAAARRPSRAARPPPARGAGRRARSPPPPWGGAAALVAPRPSWRSASTRIGTHAHSGPARSASPVSPASRTPASRRPGRGRPARAAAPRRPGPAGSVRTRSCSRSRSRPCRACRA